jgi:hypothetical protein
MEQLIYTNARGESITFATNSAIYRILTLRFAPLVETGLSSQGYQQDGYDLNSAYSEMRDIMGTVMVFGSGFDDLFTKRREIKRIMNPKLGEGVLRYTNGILTKEITVKLDNELEFNTNKDFWGYHACIFNFNFTAYNPFWRDIEYTEIDLVGLGAPFYFDEPIYYEEATAFYLGSISSANTIINNGGDVPAPLILEWVGGATNPAIECIDTGEYILLNRVLGADEKLIITTEYGNKKVFIETISTGERVQDFSIVDPSSTFFSLPVGNSTLALSADVGAGEAAVNVKFKCLYAGI